MSLNSKLFKEQVYFKSSCSINQPLPIFGLPEICFAGRSNVGKSSLINALTNKKKIASISSKPGHTKKIFFFEIAKKFILVDLPGYGYARVSKKKSNEIGNLILFYLSNRKDLKLLVLLIDSRHALKENDISFINILSEYNIKYMNVLTKIDKSSKLQIKNITNELHQLSSINSYINADIIPTSSKKNKGIEELRKYIKTTIKQVKE